MYILKRFEQMRRTNYNDPTSQPEIHESLLENHNGQAEHGIESTYLRKQFLLPWAVTFLLAIALAMQISYSQAMCGNAISSHMYSTDFEAMKPYTSQRYIRLTSPLYVTEHGTLERQQNYTEPKYVDGSDNEVDKNWEALLSGRYFHPTAAEVESLNSDSFVPHLTPVKVHGGNTYLGGIDMFHSLHCLNALPLHLRPGFSETNKIMQEIQQLHLALDHCVEQLRQSILCHGDTTPVTLKPALCGHNQPILLGETQRLHTCRDGLKLREGVNKRQSMGE